MCGLKSCEPLPPRVFLAPSLRSVIFQAYFYIKFIFRTLFSKSQYQQCNAILPCILNKVISIPRDYFLEDTILQIYLQKGKLSLLEAKFICQFLLYMIAKFRAYFRTCTIWCDCEQGFICIVQLFCHIKFQSSSSKTE